MPKHSHKSRHCCKVKRKEKKCKQKCCKGHSKANEKTWAFSVIGDTVYAVGGVEPFDRFIEEVLNEEENAFVAHIGDVQTQAKTVPPTNPNAAFGEFLSAWTAEEFRAFNRDQLFTIKHPLIVTPGDNDWAETTLGSFGSPVNPDPIGTLNAFRQVYYQEGTNVRFPFKVALQPEEQPEFSAYVENRRWVLDKIVFVTVHTIGGVNGLNNPNLSVREESVVRIQANLAWLRLAFEVADEIGSPGVVILTHTTGANPTPTTANPGNVTWDDDRQGFAEMLQFIEQKADENEERQILYIYGDFHLGLMHNPYRKVVCPNISTTSVFGTRAVGNLTAIQMPGYITYGRIRVIVNRCNKDLPLFSVDTDFKNRARFTPEVLNPVVCGASG